MRIRDALAKVDGAHARPTADVESASEQRISDRRRKRGSAGRQSENRLKTGAKHVVGTSSLGGCGPMYQSM